MSAGSSRLYFLFSCVCTHRRPATPHIHPNTTQHTQYVQQHFVQRGYAHTATHCYCSWYYSGCGNQHFWFGAPYKAGDAEACETTTVSGETTSGTDVVLAGAAGAGDGVTTAMGTNGWVRRLCAVIECWLIAQAAHRLGHWARWWQTALAVRRQWGWLQRRYVQTFYIIPPVLMHFDLFDTCRQFGQLVDLCR